MKIEMGESLIYSWLRHEKQCQLAQTNGKRLRFGRLIATMTCKSLRTSSRSFIWTSTSLIF